MYNVLAIMRGTTVDGPGFRTSIYLAGCSHKCEGCHNPQSWNHAAGTPMSLEEIMEIVREEDFDVTLSGGDPLFNPISTALLVESLKRDGRNVWIYTGYKWEDLIVNPLLKNAVRSGDVLVDGSFMNNLKNPDLLFRGSENQRLILIQPSLSSGEIVLYSRN